MSEKKLSLLDHAAKALKRRKGKSLNCRQLAEAAIKAGWDGSKENPAQALSGAMQREFASKGKKGSRFLRTEPGQWTYNAKVEQ
jgi:hypothetical protein